jgi:membrane associated rhomboid family serine protease
MGFNLNNKINFVVIGTVIVYFIMYSMYGDYLVYQFGTAKYFVVEGHQYYRIISYMFAHDGVMHLLMNMLALYSLAQPVKILYSDKYGVIIYFIAGIISGLVVSFTGNDLTVGASGAVYGIFGLIIFKAFKDYQMGYKENFKSLLPVILINLIISFMPGISLMGHLSGLIVGLVAGYLYYNKKQETKGFF